MSTAISPDTSVKGMARSARRASRRSRVQYLVTADEHSLVELETLLATLPLCAAGRVFIEVPTATDISSVVAPPRMTVTWLPREQRSGAPGTGRRCAPGAAVARAAIAWADEMLCADEKLCADSDDAGSADVTLLGGYLGTADIVDYLTERTALDASSIHVPERYRLLVR